MKKKIENNTLKFALVCLTVFAVSVLLFMLKRKKEEIKKKTTTNTYPSMKNEAKNGNYSNKISLAALNHNPTNIVKTKNKWIGEIDTPQAIKQAGRSERFKAFESDYYGILAAYNNLKSYFSKGYDTLRKIITRWAPPNENDTGGYISKMAERVGVNPDEKLTLKKHAFALIREIARIESGFNGDMIIQSVINSENM